MCERARKQPHSPDHDIEPQQDLTGRDRLVSNVILSWAAHFVFIVAGFIMPRMIDRRLGQERLGVWDFAWSLVSYFGLVQAGVGSSVNRYVAKCRAAGDMSGVNRIASSAFCVQNVAAILVLALTIAASLLLPRLFGERLGENVLEAQWVVFLLGSSIAVQMSLAVFSGVLTGCYRWGLHNVTKSGWHAAAVAGMIIALLCGGGLRSIGVIILVGLALDSVTHVILAHHTCRGLRLRLCLIGWRTIRKLFVFGGKTLIPTVSNMLLSQTISVVIIAYLGPAALALYARPRSLIRHMNTLVNKMAMTLTPTASSLQSARDRKGIQELLIKSVRYSLYMVLPMILVLAVFGGPILLIWMGSRYANGLIPAILAVGYLATMVQMPVFSILTGLNAHGRAGMAQLIASSCSVGLTILALGPLGWGLAAAAAAVTLPLTIVNVLYIPLLVCRKTGLSVARYFKATMAESMVHVLPFAICLVVARIALRNRPLTGLAWGSLVGGAVLSALYWRYALPDKVKEQVRKSLGRGKVG